MLAPFRFARLIHGPSQFHVVRAGDGVQCPVTGLSIALEDLRYWSVERQEGYANADAARLYKMALDASHHLAQVADGTTPLRKVMSHHPHTIPQYNDISAAARLMRNRRVHHVLVTHEQKLVGILSSFDLLKLMEDKRFVMKAAPTGKRKRP